MRITIFLSAAAFLIFFGIGGAFAQQSVQPESSHIGSASKAQESKLGKTEQAQTVNGLPIVAVSGSAKRGSPSTGSSAVAKNGVDRPAQNGISKSAQGKNSSLPLIQPQSMKIRNSAAVRGDR
jgi:hypothetical protein